LSAGLAAKQDIYDQVQTALGQPIDTSSASAGVDGISSTGGINGAFSASVPVDLDVHLVMDNYGTHKTVAIKSWFARHPRFHVHFTPTSASWINQIERWFAELTRKQIQRGVHTSVR